VKSLYKDDEDGDHHNIDRRHVGGVHGGAMTMETTMILKVILFYLCLICGDILSRENNFPQEKMRS
jgi:hypothetical protein